MKDVKLELDGYWIDVEDGWLCIGNDENQVLLKPEYFKKLLEAINYTRCCTMLKDKKTISFEDYIKENGFTYKIDYTYLDADGNEWLEEEIKILMKSNY